MAMVNIPIENSNVCVLVENLSTFEKVVSVESTSEVGIEWSGKENQDCVEQNKNDNLKSLTAMSKKHRTLTIVDSDSDSDSASNINREIVKNIETKNKMKNLKLNNRMQERITSFDLDSEMDNITSCNTSFDFDAGKASDSNRIDKRKSSVNSAAGSENIVQMTPKEVADLRKEIQSESQRLVRERNLALPYHKPKVHSLKEFLTRRPKLAVAVAVDPTSRSIKMSTEQLEIISKKLKEREKGVREFYNSESELEDDVQPTSNEKSKISQKQAIIMNNKTKGEEDGNNIDDLEEVLKTSNEIKSHEQILETQSPESGKENFQKSRSLQKEVGDCEDMSTISKDCTTAKTTSDLERPSAATDVPETGRSEMNMKMHEMESEICTSGNNSSPQKDNDNYEFLSDDGNTEKIKSTDNILNRCYDLSLKYPLNASRPERDREIFVSESECLSKAFTYSDIDMEIENFGSSENQHNKKEENSSDKPVSPSVKSNLNILKEKLANITPRLSGGPDKLINLNSTVVKPKEVVELMERFTKHMTSKKHNSKHKVKLSIVTVESGGDIHKETVAINVDSDNEAELEDEKSGAKLQKLKGELRKQMDEKKFEIWQQKAALGIKSSEGYEDGVHSDENGSMYCDDEEEEAEMTEEEDSEEDFENYDDLSDKPNKKSIFFDQEAEESGEENLHEEDYMDDISNDQIEESEDKEDDNYSSMKSCQIPSDFPETEDASLMRNKKVLKRILKPVDSDDEEDLFSDCIIQKTVDNEHLDSTVTADEEDIPPHQTRHLQTPIGQVASQTNSISNFLTPISFITSIQNLASASKKKTNGPAISPFRMLRDESPITKERSNAISQKKLFADLEVIDSQLLLDTPITENQDSSSDLGNDGEILSSQVTQLEHNDEPPNTQELINICSGEFTGLTQIEPSDEINKLVETDDSELKCLGADQDMIISQLLDQEELENFKKKFESPVNPITNHRISEEADEITGGRIIDSDDEQYEESGLRKKKGHRRIQFSDDEISDEEGDHISEEIDLHDNLTADDEEIDNIGYDSEENEIVVTDIGKKKKIRMTDFLEAEAELSESDWDSEDEDESNMDKLEFELGDTEKFNEEQIKEDLEKIHLRQILDDDAREVKLLQEVFLEDGEMHGTGRHRQFKWKNIDLNDDQIEENKGDNEIYLDEGDSEEYWRKKRFERELFLQDQQNKNKILEYEDHNLLNHSQLLQVGQKVLQRSQSQNNSQSNTPTENIKDVSSSSISKITFSPLSKRGSFLGRSNQILHSVLEPITTGVSVNSIKTTKNFVFQSTSASEESNIPIENKKRKACDGTSKMLKKLRLNSSFSPAVKKIGKFKKIL